MNGLWLKYCIFSITHPGVLYSISVTYPALNRNRCTFMYWSLTPRPNQWTTKITTCILSVVRPFGIQCCRQCCTVVCSSLTSRSTRKLSEAIRFPDPPRILHGSILNCLAATFYEVFSVTATAVYAFFNDLLCGYCVMALAFNRDPAFIGQNTVHTRGIY